MMTIHISRRSAVLIVAVLVATASLATVAFVRTAEANHRFDDIATGTFFHEVTAWLADQDIADGYADNTFRVNRNITRGQAAYWISNYNDSLEVVKEVHNPPAGDAFAWSAVCPAGKRAIAGGGDINLPNIFLTTSGIPFDGPDQWSVRFESEGNANVNPSALTVWALCAPNNA